MAQQTPYDSAVIGAGSGGLTVAVSLARLGKSVLLIEKDKPGGECTHNGCIPSKALLYAAKQALPSDKAFLYTQSKILEVYEEESPEMLEKIGITYLSGEAEFTSKKTLSVQGQNYSFTKAVIATGSSPRMIEIPGLDTKLILTNQNFFKQSVIPSRLLILGSGPIGLEMAQAASRLGSKVTIITRETHVGSLYHSQISSVVACSFQEMGVEILADADLVRVEGTTAYVKHNEREITRDFDKILIAIGRIAHMPEGLEVAGVTYTTRAIAVNAHYQTSNKHIYAIGDVSSPHTFTHMANHAGRVVVKHIASRGWLTSKRPAVPKVVYTTPEIAQVGLGYSQAIEEHGEENLVVSVQKLAPLDRARTDSVENGVCVVISKRLSGKIIGAEIAGPHAGELLASFTLAVEHGISMWKLSATVYPYPTLSEVVKKTADQFTLHTLSNIRGELSFAVKKYAAKVFALLFWLGMLIVLFSVTNAQGLSHADAIRLLYTFLTENMWGPLIYVVTYVLRPLIFFPATVLTTLSGALFGLPMGILLTIIGENGSANMAYWVGRFFGKDSKLENNSIIGPYVSRAQEFPFMTVLLMRFLYAPFDLVSYSSGIMRITWSAYFMATLIGILPGLITFVALGASLNTEVIFAAFEEGSIASLSKGIDLRMLACTAVLFIASLFLARYIKKRNS